MFSDMHELKMINEEVFLDRDGKAFETLVNYLRNDRKVFPEFNDKKTEKNFFKELHFWGIPAHNRQKQQYYSNKWGNMPNALNGMPSSMPSMTEPTLPMEPDMGMNKRSPHRVKSKRPPP